MRKIHMHYNGSSDTSRLRKIFQRGVLLGTFLVGVATGVISSCQAIPLRDPCHKTPQLTAQVEFCQRFGRVEYERLKIGASLPEVEAILGPGIEVDRSPTTTTFVWTNPDGSKITATFENGRLKLKKQNGLG